MKNEQNYDFRKELLTVHEKNIRNFSRTPKADEHLLADGTKISIASNASEVISVAAEDFCDYLSVSMGVKASVVTEGKGDITVRLASDVGVDLGEFAAYKGFRVETDKDGIVITAHDDRGAQQALFYIEDLMTFAHAPVIAYGKIEKRAMYTSFSGLITGASSRQRTALRLSTRFPRASPFLLPSKWARF